MILSRSTKTILLPGIIVSRDAPGAARSTFGDETSPLPRRRRESAALHAVSFWLVVFGLAAGTAETGLSQVASPAVMIHEIQVDGLSQKFLTEASAPSTARGELSSGDSVKPKRLRISSQARRLDFRFGSGPSSSNQPVRFRYQLEGVDQDWREAGGEMRLAVKFLDSATNPVSAADFEVRGETPGWAANLVDSRFIPRHEHVTVPPRAVWVQLELFSGGDEQTTGIMMIDELTVSHTGRAHDRPATRVFSSRLSVGGDIDQPMGVPRNWIRDGSKPTIAQMLKVDRLASRPVLGVVDTDSKKWGAWRTGTDSSIPVSPGDELELRWNEMYSIGWGGIREASYTYLPPGDYQFRVKAITEFGEETGEATSLAITVTPPFWKTSWFLGATLVAAIGTLVAGVRYLTWRKLKSHLEILERQRAIERERARIARDLHDDVGANLTQIALLSELAEADLAQPELARTHLHQIFAAAGGLARHLNEIVWAVNPANDTLEQFTNHTCKFAQDYLSVAGIRCRLDFPEFVPDHSMPSPERHNLFLATKEALHNIVKHAQAGQVWLRLKLDAEVLTLLIEDDGKGCELNSITVAHVAMVGDGLSNMQMRMDQIGGRFTRQSRPGRGTTVRLTLPLRKP